MKKFLIPLLIALFLACGGSVDNDTIIQSDATTSTTVIPTEITGFNEVSGSYIPLSAYFSVKKIDGDLIAGTYGYQNGKHESKILTVPEGPGQMIGSESVMDIEYFNGFYYCTTEHGQYDTVDKATIYRFDGNQWKLVFQHKTWDMVFYLHPHGDFLYATGMRFGFPNAGIIRSRDGLKWEEYLTDKTGYTFFAMTSNGTDLITAGAADSTYKGGNSIPCVWRNRKLAYKDSSRKGEGFWSVCNFKEENYLGGHSEKHARIFRLRDHKTVLDMPDYQSVYWIGTQGTQMYALFSSWAGMECSDNRRDSQIMVTSDGENWRSLGPLDSPLLFGGSFEDDGLYLAGGSFNQQSDGFGKIYKSR